MGPRHSNRARPSAVRNNVRSVPVGDAADATGVIVTVNQLALVIGVATFGTLYLNLAGHLPPHLTAGGFRLLSAHAETVTCLVLAAGLVLITVRGPREPGRESGPAS